MNLRRRNFNHAHRARGLSLIEMVMALGVGSIVIVIVGTLTIFALRSFVAMGNYSSLDARNRLAFDKMTRDVRQATSVKVSPVGAAPKWIEFETSVPDLPKVRYTWYSSELYTNTLICMKGSAEEIYLTGCEQFDFALYRRTPLTNVANSFYPATNSIGELAPDLCKMVELKWKCSRTIMGKAANTESVQSARIVLRNKL